MNEVKRYGYLGIVQEEDGEVVKWEDYAAVKAERDALAAENAALKAFFETGINASFEGCDFFGDHMQSRALELGLIREEIYCKDQHENMVVDPSDLEDGDTVYFINETPATDAYLNSVRAEGVEMFGSATIAIGKQEQDDQVIFAGKQALLFAAQLRAGKDGE